MESPRVDRSGHGALDHRSSATVRYAHSTARNAADHLIVEILDEAEDRSATTVVTSDRALRARAEALGAEVEGAGAFLSRIADIEPRRADRAVLDEFGIDESALLGRGGEARVFALDDHRVLRLPHSAAPSASIEERRRLLDAIADPSVIATPQIIEHREVHGRLVVIECRLPGHNALDLLGELHGSSAVRADLVRHHLEVSDRISSLPCPTDRFGEVFDAAWATSAPTFREWACRRVEASLRLAGERFASCSTEDLTDAMLDALPVSPTAEALPVVVHLDAFLGNMLADGRKVTAVIDFGPMTIGGLRGLDPLVSIAYLAPEITPTATDADRSVAHAWANERGWTDALEPVARWMAAYWSAYEDDHRLQQWCTRILLGERS